jgi:hypothetical protein
VVSGHEAVMVTVQAPGGTKSLLPLALEDGAGRYTALLTCSEVRAWPSCQYSCCGPHQRLCLALVGIKLTTLAAMCRNQQWASLLSSFGCTYIIGTHVQECIVPD